MDPLAETLRSQDGVIARRQLLEHDIGLPAIARMVRRRELARVHPGVYAEHTGPLTWHQRAWAAVLFSWPAALTHESALRAAEGPGRRDRDEDVMHVAVDRERRLVQPPGVRIHRIAGFDDRVRWNLGPPRVRYEHAVLDVAGAAGSDLRAIAVLADACGSRRSTAQRLVATLADRPRQARRAWISGVLDDVAAGTCSVLEQGYLSHVQRAHGLPAGRRQASHRHAGVLTLRDVDYAELGVVVELDGRLFHDSATRRDRDMDRDLDSTAADGSLTIRLSWGQVFDRPCRTASRLALVLQGRGWLGSLAHCPECG
ncbi:type IV toxin-antitoxin system AbiEi family antitoxin domain-containing protein [Nocardioides sp. CN2-186]|uniref:type IV toxin-antitoxin system AbiEi family antitoxin domain-containing protein n=1 Tax=Nocardioides tweenelious TaxID=3156607 RepID=UPI0032B45EA9